MQELSIQFDFLKFSKKYQNTNDIFAVKVSYYGNERLQKSKKGTG